MRSVVNGSSPGKRTRMGTRCREPSRCTAQATRSHSHNATRLPLSALTRASAAPWSPTGRSGTRAIRDRHSSSRTILADAATPRVELLMLVQSPRVRAYLELVRLPNLFTAVGDIVAGYLIVSRGVDVSWR